MSSHYEWVPIGKDATNPQPGDFILCHRKGLYSAFIRWGERIRFKSGSRWSHAALVETPDTIIEALTKGVVRTPLSYYRNIDYVLVRTSMDTQDANQAIAFARSCLGQKYGFLTDVAIALRFLTWGRGFWFGTNGTRMCSGLVAQAQARGWKIYSVEPSSMSPAELSEDHEVPAQPNLLDVS